MGRRRARLVTKFRQLKEDNVRVNSYQTNPNSAARGSSDSTDGIVLSKKQSKKKGAIVKCPYCPARVRRKNLTKHICKAHPQHARKNIAYQPSRNKVAREPARRNNAVVNRCPVCQRSHRLPLLEFDYDRQVYVEYKGSELDKKVLTQREIYVVCPHCGDSVELRELANHFKRKHSVSVDHESLFDLVNLHASPESKVESEPVADSGEEGLSELISLWASLSESAQLKLLSMVRAETKAQETSAS